MASGTLFLLPMLLGDSDPGMVIPGGVIEQTLSLSVFFTEEIRTTRRYLRKLDKNFDIDSSTFIVLNKKTKESEAQEMISLLKKGKSAGIISEAGLPGIGDPGSILIDLAHKNKIKVVPLTGPSSFILALAASGLNGQSFAFTGYLPIKEPQRQKRIKDLEKRSMTEGQTQIFMETPYRNNQLLKQLISVCHPNTQLCVASEITLDGEFIKTLPINKWKNQQVDLHKKPVVFAILRNQ